jgi:RND family efflux transporter MFP subunit
MIARRVLAILLVLAVVVGGAGLIRRKRAQVDAAPAPTARPTVVQTVAARTGSLQDTRTFLARVASWQVADVSVQITGRIVDVAVREGDRVREGELLATLDDAEIASALFGVDAQVAQARAQAAAQEATVEALAETARYWEKEFQRDDMLAREGAIAQALADTTADRLSEARGRLEAGRQSIEAARSQIEALGKRRAEVAARRAYTRVRSPFDGVVARRLADPGDLAVPGKSLLVVEDRSRSKLVFDVPQEEMGRVAEGMPVLVDHLSRAALAVSRLHPSLNPDRTLTVEADAPASARLSTGSYYSVKLILETVQEAVLVPEECLVESPDGAYAVFGVVDGRTRSFPVEVRLIRDGLAAVTGIERGLPVIRSTYLGWNRLASGEPVEARR